MLQRIYFLIAVFFILTCLPAMAGNSYMIKPDSGMHIGSLIGVRPEYKERYIILHKYVFPGVLDRIRKSNIRNYSIFLLDSLLFSHFEYSGSDYDKDMKDIADPVTRDWWKLTDPMQQPLSFRKEGEWWATMELLFSLDRIIKASTQAIRMGLTAEISEGKDEDVINLCKNFPEDLKEITNNYQFQNCHLYYIQGNLYYYYEYIGNDIVKSFAELNKNEKFMQFQSELNKLLKPKAGNYWQEMKEVFHTD